MGDMDLLLMRQCQEQSAATIARRHSNNCQYMRYYLHHCLLLVTPTLSDTPQAPTCPFWFAPTLKHTAQVWLLQGVGKRVAVHAGKLLHS